ncbi:hypothetical protein B7Y94_02680 [Candidatus Saccharibacteria bacterium 32-49-12]|nr:MAG: hypothetical protein B7Y94_02680 [Candidatus Saccharibacteria bacterium 32-49-12]
MPMLNPQGSSRQNSRGFTLVELLIAIVVIAILATISVIAFNGMQDKAKLSSLMAAATNTAKRIELDKATRGNYATQLSSLRIALITTVAVSSINTAVMVPPTASLLY